MLADPSSSSTTTALQGISTAVEVDASYHEASRQSNVLELVESTEGKAKAVYTKSTAKGNGGKDGMVKN